MTAIADPPYPNIKQMIDRQADAKPKSYKQRSPHAPQITLLQFWTAPYVSVSNKCAKHSLTKGALGGV
jgi:hypothetical protein